MQQGRDLQRVAVRQAEQPLGGRHRKVGHAAAVRRGPPVAVGQGLHQRRHRVERDVGRCRGRRPVARRPLDLFARRRGRQVDLLGGDDPVAAAVLRLVQAAVGLVDQLLRIGGPVRPAADPERGRHRQLRQVERLNRPAEPFGRHLSRVQRGVRQQNAELFAPVAGDQVGVAGGVAKGLGDPHQHIVAHTMPVLIVDRLEMVHVGQDAAQGVVVPVGALPLRLELVEQPPPVHAPGQHVVRGEAFELGVLPLDLLRRLPDGVERVGQLRLLLLQRGDVVKADQRPPLVGVGLALDRRTVDQERDDASRRAVGRIGQLTAAGEQFDDAALADLQLQLGADDGLVPLNRHRPWQLFAGQFDAVLQPLQVVDHAALHLLGRRLEQFGDRRVGDDDLRLLVQQHQPLGQRVERRPHPGRHRRTRVEVSQHSPQEQQVGQKASRHDERERPHQRRDRQPRPRLDQRGEAELHLPERLGPIEQRDVDERAVGDRRSIGLGQRPVPARSGRGEHLPTRVDHRGRLGGLVAGDPGIEQFRQRAGRAAPTQIPSDIRLGQDARHADRDRLAELAAGLQLGVPRVGEHTGHLGGAEHRHGHRRQPEGQTSGR